MPDIDGLHPLLGEYKQHFQSRANWSESKLMIRDQAIWEEEGFDIRSNDGFHDFADKFGSRQIGL